MEVRSRLQVKTCKIMTGQISGSELIIAFRQDGITACMLVTITASSFHIILGAPDIRQGLGGGYRGFGNNEVNRNEFGTNGSTDFHHAGRCLVGHHGMGNGWCERA